MSSTFVFIFAAWIFSLSIHEFSHAIVAYQGGDYTVKDKGYLSLNPLKFMHPVLSLGLPILFLLIGGIGLPGGCVYIERHLLRSRGWDCMVSLAGPASNFILALILSIPFTVGMIDLSTENPVWNALAFLIHIQIFAVVLNMLPIPGLDGFGVLAAWMDEALRQRIYQHASTFMFILIILMINGFLSPIWVFISLVTGLLGVPIEMVAAGYDEFRLF